MKDKNGMNVRTGMGRFRGQTSWISKLEDPKCGNRAHEWDHLGNGEQE